MEKEMRNKFKKFTQIVDAFDWKKQYLNKAEDLADYERRVKSIEKMEQEEAQIRIRCKM